MKQCRPLTLTEVLIAFGLFSIILAALFSCLRSASLLQAKGAVGRESVLQRSELHQRLSQVFFYVDQGSFHVEENESLSFSFDNQVDIDPAFCGKIRGNLFLDKGHQVVLATFAHGSKTSREEVLFPSASSLTFSVDTAFISIMLDECPFVFPLVRTDPSGKGFAL